MNTSDVIAITAAVIAFFTLLATRRQMQQNNETARFSREQDVKLFEETKLENRKACRPYLTVETDTSKTDEGRVFTTFLCNYGLGPAIIKDAKILLDGSIFHPNTDKPVEELANKLLGHFKGYEPKHFSWMKEGYAIPQQGKKYVVIKVLFRDMSDDEAEKMEKIFDRTDIGVKYESIYGDSFAFGHWVE